MARRLTGGGTGAGWLLALPACLLLLCLLLPLVFVVTTAFQDGAGHAGDAVTGQVFLDAAVRTLVMAAVVTVISLVVGSLYALGLAVSGGAVRLVLFGSLFATFWISLLVRTYGWIIAFQPVGALQQMLDLLGLHSGPIELLQTQPAMYAGMVHIMLPYMILPVLGALRELDAAQLRAAQSLGAGPRLILWRVVLPQMRGGMVAGSTLVFLLALGFYVTPRFLGGPSDLTVATVIDQEFSRVFDFAAASAMGLGLLVSVLALYVLADRVLKVSRRWEEI